MPHFPHRQRGLQMLGGNLSCRATKRRVARQHLPEYDSSSVDVGADVHLSATKLFGTRVPRSSQEDARLRQGGFCRNLSGYLDKAKIDHLNRCTIFRVERDNEVSRFDIAVNKTSLMCRSQSGGDLGGNVQS